MHSVLVVDDEPNYLIILAELLQEEGFEVFTDSNAEDALKTVKETELDLVLTDMRMPGMDGIELLRKIKSYNSGLPVIMVTAFGEVDKAVAAMQAGAFNYLTKPFNNQELLVNIRKAVEHYRIIKENNALRREMRDRYSFSNIIGKSRKMQELYSLIEKVAPTSSTVLITGESGSGKELVAKAIHFNSTRKDNPFVSINCAGFPETLLESELFGHEKGAFTGAHAQRKGRFELADTGTLFLDEIGEMPLPLQVKLLRVLQEPKFERLGGTQTLKVDARIITATNKDLKEEVEKGRFREDLYYRLNVIHLHMPPLRERKDDIPMLTDHFVAKFAKRLNKPDLEISTDAIRFLVSLPWDGNVRELENSLERAAVLCQNNTILPEDVQPDSVQLPEPDEDHWEAELNLETVVPPSASLPVVLDTIERRMVKNALAKEHFVQTRAAELLGITKSLLQYKMKKYNLQKKN